jgi:predicted oxidoreductase
MGKHSSPSGPVDAIVVGTGLAGVAAALTVAESGATVRQRQTECFRRRNGVFPRVTRRGRVKT